MSYFSFIWIAGGSPSLESPDHPEACWMRQVACNATLEGMGHLNGCRYVLHDRDAKFCAEFRETLAEGA
jgi:hypothetical protein